jgi:hypothetical protein
VPASLTYEFVQSASRVFVVLVYFQVFGQLADPGGKQSNLYFRRTGVARVDAVLLDDI